MTAKRAKERFLSRWSRRKRRARAETVSKSPAKAQESQPAPELPPLDQLNYESDFKAFMDKRVDDGLRRLALKKLFGDPRFNVTDGLDDYAEDYSALEDLPAEMVDLQRHAQRILRGQEPDGRAETATSKAEGPSPEGGAQPAEPAPADARKDTAASDERRAQSGDAAGTDSPGDSSDGRG